MNEFEHLVGMWNLVKEGSVQCELSQEHDMVSVHVTYNTAIIDIKHPSAVEFISPFLKKNLNLRPRAAEHLQNRGSILLGVLGAFRAKRTELSDHLSMAQEIADILAENKKSVILKEKGKLLAKLGYGADSLGMRMLSLKHIEVNDLSALMGLLEKAKLG